MSIRCVHCSLRLDRITRHRLSEESEEIVDRIKRWVYPRDVSIQNKIRRFREETCRDSYESLGTNVFGTDFICHACWELITQNVEQLPEVRGHRNVCVACGRSILRVRSRSLLRPEMSERDHFILRIIAEWIQPLQIQAQDEVCLPCWLRAQRVAINHQEQDIDMVQAEPSNSETVRQDSSETINQQEQDIDMVQAGPSNNETVRQISSEASPEENVQEDNPVQTQSSGSLITLPSIRRAAATASRCIFTECDDHEKLNVPESIRRRILIDFNFYIPINARICLFHLGSNLFHELYSAQNSLNTFTAEYIEDMVFLLREVKQFDFSHPENMDDHLFKYWMFLDNRLGEIVQRGNFNMRHSMFHDISTTNIVFPVLSEEDLKLIALGTYQIRQARSYVGEHMRAEGIYTYN
ncbi:hypothetical protein ACJJTC_003395 [Scirpophaga incertulas]